MKRISAVLLAVLLLTACSSKPKEKETLRVFNWGNYIDPTLITDFEKEFNATVVYEQFDSNESMYLKFAQDQTYDILVPTDYMVQRLREEGLIQKLDYSKISNFKNVIPTLLNRDMDPKQEYTVPNFWGNVGIVYNKTRVQLQELEAKQWSIFQDSAYKDRAYFLDSERDAFMVALKNLGYSVNTTNKQELDQAAAWLNKMHQTVRPIYARVEIIDAMISGIRDITTMYSGDASFMLASNKDLGYYVPTEGTDVWMDAMVIPTKAPNPNLAHQWIDFMLRHDSAIRVSKTVGYTSAVQSAVDELSSKTGPYAEVESFLTRLGYDKDESYAYDATTRQVLADLWLRVKALPN